MFPLLVFDIETVPDTGAGRRLYGLEGLADADVAQAMFHRRLQKTGRSDFLPHHLHRVVAISVAVRGRDSFKVWSMGREESSEAELIRRFFEGIERYTPVIVSWNGGGFDLPVLHYRSLVHGIAAPRYWETGDEDSSFRYNSYISRFHWRHVDLMDVLAGFSNRAYAPLHEIASMLGLPGKLGMDGSKVWDHYCAGDLAGIRAYCETDVVNTYLIYRRFDVLRGRLNADSYRTECAMVREALSGLEGEHWRRFLEAWTDVALHLEDAPPAD